MAYVKEIETAVGKNQNATACLALSRLRREVFDRNDFRNCHQVILAGSLKSRNLRGYGPIDWMPSIGTQRPEHVGAGERVKD